MRARSQSMAAGGGAAAAGGGGGGSSSSSTYRLIEGWRNKMHFLRRQSSDNAQHQQQRQPLMEETAAGHATQLQLAAEAATQAETQAEGAAMQPQSTLMTTIAEDAAETSLPAAVEQQRNGGGVRGMGVVIVSMDADANVAAGEENVADEAL